MPPHRGQGGCRKSSASRNARPRRPISCLPCRNRKLRCDRKLPACGSCVNRGEITSCFYVPQKEHIRQVAEESPSGAEAAQARLDRLESLVISLLESRQDARNDTTMPPTGTAALDGDRHPEDTIDNSHQQVQENRKTQDSTIAVSERLNTSIKIGSEYRQSRSVDEGHWALLLNEIEEVRSHLQAAQRQYEEQAKKIISAPQRTVNNPGPALLFGSDRNLSRAEVMAQLPSRYCCDLIVTRFFDHLYPAIHILHQPTFKKQYSHFWVHKSDVSMAWVALLFGILRIGALDYVREDDEPLELAGKCLDLANTFRNRLTDCMILSDYLQPQEFLMEALCMHMYGEYVSSRDARSSVWVLLGMIIRLALRMGYNQPSQPALPSTPFKLEMRRRIWTFIRQADIIISFQMGLPAMLELPAHKGFFPRNIYDDERFDEDCTSLPPPLPDSEPTQISYLIAKAKLAFGFAHALKEINCSDGPRWERILEIDREIRHLYDKVPENYKLDRLSDQDSLVLTSARFVLASIHHKSLCVIHSRFLETAKSDYRYAYSRKVCLNSALSILHFQAIQNKPISISGRLRSLTNYQTSLTIHDYLLAATIISVDLCSNAQDTASADQASSHDVPGRLEMIRALALSARIFSQMKDRSMEAFKASDVLGMLVRRFQATQPIAENKIHRPPVKTGQPSWSKRNVPDIQSMFRSPVNVLNKMSTMGIPEKSEDTNEMLQGGFNSPEESLNYNTPSISGFSGPLDEADLDAFSTWPGTQLIEPYNQSSPFTIGFPETGTSRSWVGAEHDENIGMEFE